MIFKQRDERRQNIRKMWSNRGEERRGQSERKAYVENGKGRWERTERARGKEDTEWEKEGMDRVGREGKRKADIDNG